MASTIIVPSGASLGGRASEVATNQAAAGDPDATLANAVITLATAAAADINALQLGTSITGVNGTTIAAGGALTTGQVLRATGAAAAAFGALSLSTAAAVTGVLPGANVAPAVAAVSQGVVTAADQTHINSSPTIQLATVTLVAGTATINTVIVLSATSRIICNPTGAITGSTNYGSCRELFASRVNGAASTATAVIEAVSSDGTKDTDAAGDVHLIILTPHA